jgi:surfeit locus 1 family protein
MIGALTLIAVAGFTALGIWQVHRRAWKLQLIAEIDSRIHATPVPAPGPPAWPAIDAAHDAYRRITASGVFLNDRTILVQAATDLGSGYWVMTPLRTDAGFTILVNRGFVPPDRPNIIDLGEGPDAPHATVIGLLRVSEPKGGFLHSNDPADNRWYSRDVTAIAQARDLRDVAPYFIDAGPTPPDQPGPVGGLTVINLPNNHLVYLLTWFTLAAMSAGGGIVPVWKQARLALPRPARSGARLRATGQVPEP